MLGEAKRARLRRVGEGRPGPAIAAAGWGLGRPATRRAERVQAVFAALLAALLLGSVVALAFIGTGPLPPDRSRESSEPLQSEGQTEQVVAAPADAGTGPSDQGQQQGSDATGAAAALVTGGFLPTAPGSTDDDELGSGGGAGGGSAGQGGAGQGGEGQAGEGQAGGGQGSGGQGGGGQDGAGGSGEQGGIVGGGDIGVDAGEPGQGAPAEEEPPVKPPKPPKPPKSEKAKAPKPSGGHGASAGAPHGKALGHSKGSSSGGGSPAGGHSNGHGVGHATAPGKGHDKHH